MLIPDVHFDLAPISRAAEANRYSGVESIDSSTVPLPFEPIYGLAPLRTSTQNHRSALGRAHVHTHALTFHLAAVFDASLVDFDWQLQQRLQVGHGSQVTALSPNSGRIAGPKVGAGGPCREIRRQELGERP